MTSEKDLPTCPHLKALIKNNTEPLCFICKKSKHPFFRFPRLKIGSKNYNITDPETCQLCVEWSKSLEIGIDVNPFSNITLEMIEAHNRKLHKKTYAHIKEQYK